MYGRTGIGAGTALATLLVALALLHCCWAKGEGEGVVELAKHALCSRLHGCLTVLCVAVRAGGAPKYRLQVVTVATE